MYLEQFVEMCAEIRDNVTLGKLEDFPARRYENELMFMHATRGVLRSLRCAVELNERNERNERNEPNEPTNVLSVGVLSIITHAFH